MDLTTRVELLERRQRRTAVAFVLAAAVGTVGIGASRSQKAQPSDNLDTTMLRLWDDQGNLRGFLGTTPKGNTTLTLADGKGKVCAVFGVMNDANPSIELSHSDDKLRARLALSPEGKPYLVFYDAEGNVIHQHE